MRDWKRSTREYAFDGLQQDMRGAISKHIADYNLGDVLAGSLMCVETTSDKMKKDPLGGGEKNVVVVAIITARWLIWAIRGDRPGVTVMSARLADVVIQDYATTQFARMVPDTGFEVSGSFTDVSERGAAFIGLGQEPPARRFKQTVIDAVQAAKT